MACWRRARLREARELRERLPQSAGCCAAVAERCSGAAGAGGAAAAAPLHKVLLLALLLHAAALQVEKWQRLAAHRVHRQHAAGQAGGHTGGLGRLDHWLGGRLYSGSG